MLLQVEHFSSSLAERLNEPESGLGIYWLGQAGFAIRQRQRLLLIDPYLSNYLEEKYAGKRYSHRRMMAAPLQAEEVSRIDAVLCTHRHGDHCDPVTLRHIVQKFPECRIVIPAAEERYARQIGLPQTSLVLADAVRGIELGEKIEVLPLPAAHESFEVNAAGHHHFLGYLIRLGDAGLFHSGDTVPFAQLTELLRKNSVQVAMLPVNGRSRELCENGIAGNFTLPEAIQLCEQAQIPNLIAHHFGMFEFNTIDPKWIDKAAANRAAPPAIFRAQLGCCYRVMDDRE